MAPIIFSSFKASNARLTYEVTLTRLRLRSQMTQLRTFRPQLTLPGNGYLFTSLAVTLIGCRHAGGRRYGRT